jgi:Integrase core domain
MKVTKNERFNGTLRREVLNAGWFPTTRQAQVAINQWLRQNNHIRQHHALGIRPPVPETILEKPQISGLVEGARHGRAPRKFLCRCHSDVRNRQYAVSANED